MKGVVESILCHPIAAVIILDGITRVISVAKGSRAEPVINITIRKDTDTN